MQIIDLLRLCFEFFKTGLFAVGGGLATLPFLSQMSDKYPHWFTQQMLADMIAVSESTPGPIGVNMATYAGFTVWGVVGAVLATLSLVFPSIVIVLLIAKALNKYNKSALVQRSFAGLRPAVTGLIAAAGFTVLKMALLSTTTYSTAGAFFASVKIPALVLFGILTVLLHLKSLKKIHPVAFIAFGALAGIVLKF